MSFVKIHNRNNFLISEVPEIHPKSLQYIKYWKRQKKRCIEGLWSIDDASIEVNVDEDIPAELEKERDSWRFIPGNLYFYVNFGTILHQDENGPKSAPKKKMRPYLRDIEWEFFYNWLEARGFSGFSKDEEFSADRGILEVLKGSTMKLSKECYNSKGELKAYKPAREMLRELHHKPIGHPLYNNQALNLFMLGSRGFGKSFMVGVGIVLHELLFDGAKVYDEQSIKDPYKTEIFVGAAISSKSSDILSKTREALDNLPGEWGIGTNDYAPSPFMKTMAGTLAPNNMKNPWRHEYEKKMGGTWKKFGTGSNIKHGIFTTENPEAAAGTRPGVIAVEEVGLLPNVLTVHGSNTACQMEGSWKFGSTVYLGTGGNVEKIQESEVIFRDPIGFDFVPFEDEWEGSGKIGWFVSCIYAMNQFKDENGNTDVEGATAFKEAERDKKRQSKDPSALSLEMMNYPMIPSEMFLNAKGAMFPQAMLKAHLAEVQANPHRFENAHWHIELIWDDKGNLKLEHANANTLEKDWPVKDNKNRPGVIEVFEMPKKDAMGNVFRSRYLQGTDTYDDDASVTTSLGSTWVLDMWTGRLVAEYTGRRGTKEFYEICRKLNIFYKTEHNYENNKKGLYSYYDQKSSTHLLCDTPESLRDVADITISKIGNKAKGTTASKPVNAYGLRLILDWLLEPAYGEEEGSEVLNLHRIRSQGLLKELINFNPDGNFDRVSALIMLMILKEDKIKFAEKKQRDKVKTIADDDFFARNFKPIQTAHGQRKWNFPS
jgi:hypothetical protein